MRKKPFEGIYKCENCGSKHRYYFFNSKPKETTCGRCFKKDTAKLVRRIKEPAK